MNDSAKLILGPEYSSLNRCRMRIVNKLSSNSANLLPTHILHKSIVQNNKEIGSYNFTLLHDQRGWWRNHVPCADMSDLATTALAGKWMPQQT